uniref:ORF75b n=1 Tax=Pinus koraiensis TaxID=88728 RepID=A4QM95_PINKO|nr:ORF75b [Pinus koraiensis]ABP35432.1 ORF75b [Pinus koraiensis]
MAEWLMAPVLKTGIVKKNYRGFESLSLLLFFNNHIYWSGPIKKKKENSSAVYSRATRIQLEREYLKILLSRRYGR